MQATNPTTLIIGAGPAGLAIAGQLAHRHLPFTVLEASEHIGLTWRNHYDRLHLHTVKAYSALPHRPYPADYPAYASRLQVVDYLERYAEHFAIKPLFNQNVTGISRKPTDGTWQVRTTTEVFSAGQVVVATGYNRVPNLPEFPGQRSFRGIVWHSHTYRNGAPFRNENVLVVGMGNTGAELALDLLANQARPFISVRGPVNIVRREFLGQPVQSTALFLSRFPDWFCDFIVRLSQQLSVGDVSAYGLGKPVHAPSYDARRGKTPVIDVGTLDQIKAGTITVVPGIDQINAKTVTFTDGRELPFDAILLATGYRPALASILGDELAAAVLNERGYPEQPWFDDTALQGLYFLGFSTPVTGLIHQLTIDSDRIASRIFENNFSPA